MSIFAWLEKALRELFAPPPSPTLPVPVVEEDGLVGYAQLPLERPLPDTYDLADSLPEKLEDARDFSTRKYRLRRYYFHGLSTIDVYVPETANSQKLLKTIHRLIENRELDIV